MRVSIAWKASLLAAGMLAPLRAQEFRVELSSKTPLAEVRMRAGREPLRVCESRDRGRARCLIAASGAEVRCLSDSAGIRCTTEEKAERFRRAFVLSPLPFQLAATSDKAHRGAAFPAASVRAAELHPAGSGLRVVVTLELEAYVSGVLAGEAATLKSPPALAAMAVVARTWALGSRGRHRTRGFDFCSLTHCQFFRLPLGAGGAPSSAVALAVGETSGEVLEYRDRLADPYYSAHCGGVTETASAVWPDRRAPYLTSVTDPYCARGPQPSWEQALSLKAVERILREKLRSPIHGKITELRVAKRSESGRAQTLEVLGGSAIAIDANEFRYAANRELGWNTLKSNLYEVQRRGDALVFSGRGLGHGVGLCQAGAEQMGQMGLDYRRILSHYFPGTAVDQHRARTDEQILSSEHFELVFPAGQRPWVDETLRALEAARQRLGSRADTLPGRVRVHTWQTTEEFIRASGQPGWVAASNDGRGIQLQPLQLLKRKGILESTLRHELTHLVVRRLRAPNVPRWYEEGLVLFLTGEKPDVATAPNDSKRNLEERVSRPRSEAEMKAAYAEAARRIRELVRQRGGSALWRVLQRPTAEDTTWFRSQR